MHSEVLALKFKDQIIQAVSPFSLKRDIDVWPGSSDPLFRAIRTFYLLVPAEGLATDWNGRVKLHRRRKIKSHLECVCDATKITPDQVDLIDRWLTNIGAARNQLQLYGRQVEEKFGRICHYCGKIVDADKSIDHVLPLSRGGSDEISNYRIVHKGCNASKNNLLIGDQLVWAPQDLRTALDDLPSRLRYLVFLRDDFTCTNEHCTNGIKTGQELSLDLIHRSGICCYDNLRTRCMSCHQSEKGLH